MSDDKNLFDDDILDFDDNMDTDVKIRAPFYIHTALLLAQRTLMFATAKSSASDGILTYTVFIEHIETICKSAGYIDVDLYKQQIKEFEEEEKKSDNKNESIRIARRANKKLELLMTQVFSRSPVNMSLSI